MRKFVYRMDDICPEMDWKKFNMHIELFSKHRIVPLLGVVPENEDKSLKIDRFNPNFWDIMKDLQKTKRVEIAQHGTHHVYHRIGSSFLGNLYGIPQISEFAGLPKADQYNLLEKGRNILFRKGLETSVFMAPSHTFDRNTLKVLHNLGFTHITDGKGLFPYKEENLTFIPVQFGAPRDFPLGVVSICLHSNTSHNEAFGTLKDHVEKFAPFAIKFSEAENYLPNPLEKMANFAFKTAYSAARKIKT